MLKGLSHEIDLALDDINGSSIDQYLHGDNNESVFHGLVVKYWLVMKGA
jgi:hypothetical protein